MELIEIVDGDVDAPASTRRRVGCIAMDESGGWSASCPGLDCAYRGEGPFDGLSPEAFWLVDRDYEETKALQEAAPGLMIRFGGWMRGSLSDMPDELGLQDVEESARLGIAATALDRAMKLCGEAALADGAASSLHNSGVQSAFERAPSLSTGLRQLMRSGMDAGVPADGRMRTMISRALSYGASRYRERAVREGEFEIRCRAPRLTHALRATSFDVPDGGVWRKADLPPGAMLDDERIGELRGLGLPILVSAVVKERPGFPHAHYRSWVRPGGFSAPRTSYVLDEVDILSPWYRFEDCSVFVGSGWRRPETGRLLAGLVRVCGGRDVASASWSANLAAENVLCGGFRRLGRTEALPPECVWLAARDRIEMVRPVQALLDCGATLVSVYAGAIVAKVPADPELISLASHAIWENGLQLSPGAASRMRALGVEPPSDDEAFGGEPEDLFLGTLSMWGEGATIRLLDNIVDLPLGRRGAAFANATDF